MANDKRKNGEEKRANQEAAGIPDSRIFAQQTEPNAMDRMLVCHINGVAIAELNLDPQVLAALDYWATDEGIQEKNARPNVRDWAGQVEVGADPHDKAIEQRKDDVKERDIPLYQARDPLKELEDRYVGAGMKGKFLSASRIKDGAGAGDYEIVKDEKGDPVRVRTLVLGQMPAEKAEARNRFYRNRSSQMLQQIGETYKREGGKTAVSDQDEN